MPRYPLTCLLAAVVWAASCGDHAGSSGGSTGHPAEMVGTFQRLSYPYGTIEITPDSVKFVAGEGLAEPPQFMAYRLSDRCPYAHQSAPLQSQYLVMPGSENCEAFTLQDDTLRMFYPPGGEEVVYVKQ